MAKNKTNPGELIRVYRKAKGLTLMNMGDKLGITHQQYQRYENGETPPPFDRLAQIIRILEIPPQKLFNAEDINDYAEQFDKKIAKYGRILKMLEDDPKLIKMIMAYGVKPRRK